MVAKADEDVTETWAPDSRWAAPAVLSAWTWSLGWLPVWAANQGSPFWPWLMGGFGILAAFIGMWRARAAWPENVFGESLPAHGSLLAVMVGLVTGGWLVYAGYTTPWAGTPALLAATAGLGVWFAALVTSAPKRAAEEAARAVHIASQTELEAMREIMDDSACGDVKIFVHTPTRAGSTWEIGPDPSFRPRPTLGDVQNRMDSLTTNLAIYWRSRNGTVLGANDVRLEEIAADRWLLHVSTEHVLTETITYRPSTKPQSFNMPVWLGLYEDGADMRFKLCRSGMKLIGSSGGGKSNIVNNIIARTLECRSADLRPDAVVWVAATQKLVPLVYPWLVPWITRQAGRPPIDFVVGEAEDDVKEFLRRVYFLIKDRNQRNTRRSKHEATPDSPGILIILEEARIMTGDTTPIAMGNGEEWTVSRLLAECAAVSRSSGIAWVMVTQLGLYDGLGAWGDELQRHLTVRMCTVTETAADGYNTLPKLPGNVDTTMLRDYSVYLQVGLTEQSRAMPGKVAHLDEELVPPVALSLSHQLASLPQRDIDVLGDEWYRGRWDADRLPVLVEAARYDTESPNGAGYSWPEYGAPTQFSIPVPVDTLIEEESVHTPDDDGLPAEPISDPAVDAVGDAADWRDEWDTELQELLGRHDLVDAPDVLPEPGERPAWAVEGDAVIDRLWQVARQMEADADAAEAETASMLTPKELLLPLPLQAVIHHLGLIAPEDHPEWIPTAELAAIVWGPDVKNGALKMGQALNKNWRGLTSTEPRELPDGSRVRGYLVRDLFRAACAIRDGATSEPE